MLLNYKGNLQGTPRSTISGIPLRSKLWTAYANHASVSPQSNYRTLSLGNKDGRYQQLKTVDPCAASLKVASNGWAKIGGQIRHKFMLAVLEIPVSQIIDAIPFEEAHHWIVFQAYIITSYVIFLRVMEGLLIDLAVLNRFWDTEKDKRQHYVVIQPLQGKPKGELNHFCHLIPCVPITSSRIRVESSL